MLEALRVVDEVVVYETVGIKALEMIDFDVLALGEDHKGERFDVISNWCRTHNKKYCKIKKELKESVLQKLKTRLRI